MCQHADLFTKPLDIQQFHKPAKKLSSMKYDAIQMLGHTVSAASCLTGKISSREAKRKAVECLY